MKTKTNTHDEAQVARERILQVAEQLFGEHGLNSVSINAIAEQAKVSKANIFHHFGSKQELYHAVVREAVSESLSLLEKAQSSDGSLHKQLKDVVRGSLENMLRNEKVSRLIIRELLDNDKQRGKALIDEVFGTTLSRFSVLIKKGQKKGELRKQIDPAALAILLYSANLIFVVAHEAFDHLPEINFANNPDMFNAKVMDIFSNGIHT